jgi:dCMP deaminase
MHTPLKLKYSPMYWAMAYAAQAQTEAEREQVGCVIVTPQGLVIPGYNGQPAGWHTNCCENAPIMEMVHGVEKLRMKTDRSVLHAENNAIGKATRAGISLEGAHLYSTVSPCDPCARQIIPSGIAAVFYDRLHDDTTGVDIIHRCGISIMPRHEQERILDLSNSDRRHPGLVPG